jgi:hypothetical protein
MIKILHSGVIGLIVHIFGITSRRSVISEGLLVSHHGLRGFNVRRVRSTREGKLEDDSTEVSNFSFEGIDFSLDSSGELFKSGLSLVVSSSFDGEGSFEVFFNIIEDSEDGVNHGGVSLDWGSFSNRG